MPILGVILGCNPHSMVVQTLLLGEVQNIEGGHSEVSLVLDWKVKPLVMASTVRVHSHGQVKFTALGLVHGLQVTRFEIWVEHKWRLAKGDFLKPRIIFQIRTHARKRRLFSLHSFLNLGHCVEQVGLGRELHVVAGGFRGGPSYRLLIGKCSVHRQTVRVALAVVNCRVGPESLRVLEIFKHLIVKYHRDGGAVDVLRTPAELHVRLERVLPRHSRQGHRRQRVQNVLTESRDFSISSFVRKLRFGFH